MTTTDREKTLFILGILISTASCRGLITYDELRRLARLSDRQLGTFLGKVRLLLATGEPDICSVVVKEIGKPGWGWGNLTAWQNEINRTWKYWQDRRVYDNDDFIKHHTLVPSVPGTKTP